MAKVLDQLLDDEGNALPISSEAIIDKATNKTLSEFMASSQAPTTEEINNLINEKIVPLQTMINDFLNGDPDDNDKIDRLQELVAAIDANKTDIENYLKAAGTGIAIVPDSTTTPTYNGKIRMVVNDYNPTVTE